MQKSGPYFAKYFCCVKSIRKNVPNFDVCHPTPAPRSHKSVNLGSHCGTLLIHRKRLILTSVSSLYLSSRVTPCFLKFFQVWGVLKGDQKLMQTPFFCATFLFLEHSHKRTSINYVDWILRILTPPLSWHKLMYYHWHLGDPSLARQRSLWMSLTTKYF